MILLTAKIGLKRYIRWFLVQMYIPMDQPTHTQDLNSPTIFKTWTH